MKKILFNAVLLTFIACNDTSKEKLSKMPKITEVEINYDNADRILSFDAEKVNLLSILKEIPQEKVNSVLRDYLAKKMGISDLIKLENPNYIVNLVDTLAKENGLTRKMTASIIFDYQYEVITEGEPDFDFSQY